MSQLLGNGALLFLYCMTFSEPDCDEKTTVAHWPQKKKQNKIFLTIAEIHNPNFITSNIQNPGPKKSMKTIEHYLISSWYYCSGFSKIPFHSWAQVSRDKIFFSICEKFPGFRKDSWIVNYFQFSWKVFMDLWIKPGFEIVFSIWQPFQKQFVSKIVILNIFFRFINISVLSLFTFCKDLHLQPLNQEMFMRLKLKDHDFFCKNLFGSHWYWHVAFGYSHFTG